MKKIFCIFLVIVLNKVAIGQNVQVHGQLKINNINTNNSATDVLVRNADGTINKRSAISLADLQVSVSGDTIKINDKNFWIWPGISAANWVVDGSGNPYRITKIGTQTWIRSNLRTTKYNDGTPIPKVTNAAEWGMLTTPGYCWYNNDSINFSDRGALYNAFVCDSSINGNKNVCPVGYHIPISMEMFTLHSYLGTDPGAKLKGKLYWTTPTGNLDSYLFNSLPNGPREPVSGLFLTNPNLFHQFWVKYIFYLEAKLDNYNTSFNFETASLQYGISIRCLKD